MDSGRWYVKKEGLVLGPYSTEELRSYVARGKVLASDAVGADGETGWIPARQVPWLGDVLATSGAPTGNVSSTATPARAWYLAHGNDVAGPVELDALRNALAQGHLSLDDRLCEAGAATWRTVGDVLMEAGYSPPTQLPAHPVPTPAPAPPGARPPAPSPPAAGSPASSQRHLALVGAALTVLLGAVVAASIFFNALHQRPSHPAPPVPPSLPLATAAAPGPDGGSPAVAAAPDAGSDRSTNGLPLPYASSRWGTPDLREFGATCPEGLWSLFSGHTPGADEFARHANEEERRTIAAALRAQRFVVRLRSEDVRLGEYDFQREAFPVRIGEEVEETCSSPFFDGVDGFDDRARIAFTTPRLTSPAMPGEAASDRVTAARCSYDSVQTDAVHPYHWSAPVTWWIPVPRADAPAFRARHGGALAAQVAFRVTGARADRQQPMLFARMSTLRYVCGLHGGAGRVVVATPLAVQINDAEEVLLDVALPVVPPRPSATSAGLRDNDEATGADDEASEEQRRTRGGF